MLIPVYTLTNKFEELYHQKLFKAMKNSTYIILIEYQLENSSNREKKRIRKALNHIFIFPDPFYADSRLCKEDVRKIQPLMDEWVKTNRLILAFPLTWIIAFTIGMKIYVD